MPVPVLIPRNSPRLSFVLHVLFERVLGLPFVVQVGENETSGLAFGLPPKPGDLFLFDSGFMWETGSSLPPPALPPASAAWADFQSTDLFAAAFRLLSEYDAYHSPLRDQHGRYLEPSDFEALDLDSQPVIHNWAALLAEKLFDHFPSLRQEQRLPEPGTNITLDLDNPWKFRHKPLHVRLGGMALAALRRDWQQVAERLRAWTRKEDPNDTFGELAGLLDPGSTTLFILLERTSPHDSRFTWQHKAWREKIAWLQAAGFRLGIHPSYRAGEESWRIAGEAQHLAGITGKAPEALRMHFLRYQLPGSRRAMIDCGIRFDYSPCRVRSGGFPMGMALPFPWYDLEAEAMTSLTLVPSVMMDRTLLDYLRLSPEEGKARTEQLRRATLRANGRFVVCLHNECLSESGEWRGWRPVFSSLIRSGNPAAW